MKTRNVFLSMGLAFLMGLAGCQSTGPMRALAAGDNLPASTKLYLDFGGEGNGWAADGANVYAWVWYSTSSWETVSYESTSGYYTFTLASQANGMTLLREAGSSPARSGTTWGTGDGWNKLDVNFETGKDLLAATSAGSVGSWSKYVAPTPASPLSGDTITMYLSDEGAVLGATPSAFAWTDGNYTVKNNGDWPGASMTKVKDGLYSIEVAEEFEGIVFNGNSKQTIDLVTTGHDGYTFTINSTPSGGKYEGVWTIDATFTYTVTRGGSPVATDVEMKINKAKTEYTEYYSDPAVALQLNDIVSFKRDGVAFAVGAKDGTKVADTNDGLKVVQAGTETLYLDVDSAKLWAGGYVQEDGTYLRGLGGHFGSQYQVKMTASSLEGYTMKIENVELAANNTVKVSFYGSETESWLDAISVSCDHEAEFPVSIDGEANAKVTNAGHYDLHVNTSSGAYHFIARDYVAPTYTLFAGESSLGQLVLNSGSEYKLLGVSLTAGQVLSYKVNGVAAEGVTAKVIKNNNLTSGLEVLATVASADVYVDVSAKTIWVSGLSEGYHMLVNGATLYTLTHTDDYDGFEQYYSDMVSFAANDVIRFINCHWKDEVESEVLPEVFDVTTITGSESSKFQVVEGHLQAKEANSVKVYLKLKYGQDQIYLSNVSPVVGDATAFATAFNNAFKAICKDSGTNVTDLRNAWKEQSGAGHYLALSAEAKLELKTNNTVQEIKDFRAKYELIYSRYAAQLDEEIGGGAGSGNFAGLEIAESISAVTMPVDNTYIVVLSIAATVTLVGLTAIILRKKKLAK